MESCPIEDPPLFTFGVIADIQYADIDDGFNYTRTQRRYYRSSLQLLRNARESWSRAAVKPSFILQLGDIIDGFNKQHDSSDQALDTVLREMSTCPAQVHHVWGNHEFYNFTRDTLMKSKLNSSPPCDSGGGGPHTGDIYAYHFNPTPKFKVVVLDAYDVSVLGRTVSSVQYNNALNILKEHNSNEDLNHPPGVCVCTLSIYLFFIIGDMYARACLLSK